MAYKVLVFLQILLASTATEENAITDTPNCKTNLDFKEHVEHHRTGELTIDWISGANLNHDCLKVTNFHQIVVTGLNSFSLCKKGKYFVLRYPMINVTGFYHQDAADNEEKGDFTIRLENLEILLSRKKATSESIYIIKSRKNNVELKYNEQLKNCISKANSLINDQIVKYSKEKLRKFIQNIWDDFSE